MLEQPADKYFLDSGLRSNQGRIAVVIALFQFSSLRKSQ